MKLSLRNFCAFLVLGLVLPFASHVCAVSGPKIFIQGTSFDFGEVKEGKILEHSFIIMNKGDQPLKIERVRPG